MNEESKNPLVKTCATCKYSAFVWESYVNPFDKKNEYKRLVLSCHRHSPFGTTTARAIISTAKSVAVPDAESDMRYVVNEGMLEESDGPEFTDHGFPIVDRCVEDNQCNLLPFCGEWECGCGRCDNCEGGVCDCAFSRATEDGGNKKYSMCHRFTNDKGTEGD